MIVELLCLQLEVSKEWLNERDSNRAQQKGLNYNF